MNFQIRSFSTSVLRWRGEGPSKTSFGRVQFFNRRHLKVHLKNRKKFPNFPWHYYGCRLPLHEHPHGKEFLPELVPELVVPDLTNFKLKPYVSYKVSDIYQEEFTSKDLFTVVYGKKILSDFKAGKLDDDGNPIEPSEEEKMTSEEARIKARQTGSDIFEGGVPVSKKFGVKWDYK